MTLETKSQFAKRRGVYKSTVTREAQAGRIVMVGALVDVERSLELLAATEGNLPMHAAKREQLAEQRGDPPAAPPAEPDAFPPDEPGLTLTEIGRRTKIAVMRQAEADAETKEMRASEERERLLDAEQVKGAWHQALLNARNQLLALPARMAPELVGIKDPAEIQGRLMKRIREVLTDLGTAKVLPNEQSN